MFTISFLVNPFHSQLRTTFDGSDLPWKTSLVDDSTRWLN